MVGTPTNGDDVFDCGFLLDNVDGLGGNDLLILNYTGPSPKGKTVDHIQVVQPISGPELRVFFTDGSVQQFNILNFEHFNITGKRGACSVRDRGAPDIGRSRAYHPY